VFEFVQSGGVVMVFILLALVATIAIAAERFWALRRKKVIPPALKSQVIDWAKNRTLDQAHLEKLAETSPLGAVMAAALRYRNQPREVIVASVEDAGRHTLHEMEKPINWLSVIADVAPLLGLLGTVIGMIKVFASIMENGVGDAGALAGGISQALITTAAGLMVAIPALLLYRYLKSRVEDMTIEMEQQVMELIDSLEKNRQRPQAASGNASTAKKSSSKNSGQARAKASGKGRPA
jgi:biopolymer transport protein ExbB